MLINQKKILIFTNVASRDADAALIWRLGCFNAVGQSSARANVPIDLEDFVLEELKLSENMYLCVIVKDHTLRHWMAIICNLEHLPG